MKKRITIKMQMLLAGLFILPLALAFASCDDDNNGGQPVIYYVRTTDPATKDSTFSKGNPGQMIVIEGENLGSVKKVFFNGQEAYFNPHYVTSRSIIVTIPSELELTGTNPDLPREIRVETAGGVATCAFHVLSPAPRIIRFMVTGYPIATGDAILIQGENFYEIEKIVFEGEEGVNVAVTEYTVSTGFDVISLKMVDGAEAKGRLVVYCAAGEAAVNYARNIMPPSITQVSSDMPVIGAEFFIAGSYFIGVEKVNINGEYDIPAENLRVSPTNDTIYLKLPSQPASAGQISVMAAGGITQAEQLFYPIDHVVLNWDNIGWFSWGEGLVIEADGVNPPFISTGKCGAIIEKNVGAWNYWFGNLVNGIVWHGAISDNTPAGDLALRFECFVSYPLLTISLEVALGNWDNNLTEYVPLSMISGKTELKRWMTCEIPISQLNDKVKNYADIKALGSDLAFLSKNPKETPVPDYEIFFDNVRIVKKK